GTTSLDSDVEGRVTFTLTPAWLVPMIVVGAPEPSTTVAELGAAGTSVKTALPVWLPTATSTVCGPTPLLVGTVNLTPLGIAPPPSVLGLAGLVVCVAPSYLTVTAALAS